MAQNSTKVNRKPPSSSKKRSRKDSKYEYAIGLDLEDDDFINEVTEPVKAKTKNELLGHVSNIH